MKGFSKTHFTALMDARQYKEAAEYADAQTEAAHRLADEWRERANDALYQHVEDTKVTESLANLS